jgi:hypothetical protein
MHKVLRILRHIRKFTTNAAIALALVAVCSVAYRDIVGDTISLQPISVPKSLADDGLTPEVVASNIRADLMRVVDQSWTTMHHAQVSMADLDGTDAPDIVVPGTGYSLGGVTSWVNTRLLTPGLRARLHLPKRKVIGGEILQVEKNYLICMRLNDQVIYESKIPVPHAELDHEIAKAADETAKQTIPFIYASYQYVSAHGDPAKFESAIEVLHWIVSTMPTDDENVVRAYNLQGLILERQGREGEARNEFTLASAIAERAGLGHFSVGYLNLADLTMEDVLKAIQAAYAEQGERKPILLREASRELAKARQFAMQAVASDASESANYESLAQVEEFEGYIAAMQDEPGKAEAAWIAAKRYCDIAISLAADEPAPYWYRANLLQLATPVHDVVQAIVDRYRALSISRRSRRKEDSSTNYLALEINLLGESDEIAGGYLDKTLLPDPADDDLSWALIGTQTAGPEMVSMAVLDQSTASQTLAQRRMERRRQLLLEACDALHTVVQLWDTNDDDSVTLLDIQDSADRFDKARAPLATEVPRCLAWPGT